MTSKEPIAVVQTSDISKLNGHQTAAAVEASDRIAVELAGSTHSVGVVQPDVTHQQRTSIQYPDVIDQSGSTLAQDLCDVSSLMKRFIV